MVVLRYLLSQRCCGWWRQWDLKRNYFAVVVLSHSPVPRSSLIGVHANHDIYCWCIWCVSCQVLILPLLIHIYLNALLANSILLLRFLEKRQMNLEFYSNFCSQEALLVPTICPGVDFVETFSDILKFEFFGWWSCNNFCIVLISLKIV